MQAYNDIMLTGVRPWWPYHASEWADALAIVCHDDVQQDVRAVVLGAYAPGHLQNPNYVSNQLVDYHKVDSIDARQAEFLQQLVLADLIDGEVFDPRPSHGGKEAAFLILEQAHAVRMSDLLGMLPQRLPLRPSGLLPLRCTAYREA
jgi:hypothetical protein